MAVPVFGPETGIPFPRFGRSLGEGVTEDSLVSKVEEATIGLVGRISEREYTSRRAVSGTMPRLNRVFEELEIVYREREVPAEVLASIDKKKKKTSAKNVTAEAESKKRKGAAVARAPPKRKKKSGTLVIASVASSSGSAGVASVGSEDVESSSVPSADARVASGDDRGSSLAPVCPASGAVSDAGHPEASVAPARSSHGAVSVGEHPECSAVEPMPDILGGLCSSSEEDTEAIPRHAPSSPTVVAPSPVPAADVERLDAAPAGEAPAARASLGPPSSGPPADEVRLPGPSLHDTAETSAQRAQEAALPGLYMCRSIWRTPFCLLSSPV